MKPFAFIGIILACSAMTGCGGGEGRPALVPVTGKILLGSEPLVGAQVLLLPERDEKSTYGRPSSAITDDAGQFRPTTYQTGDGLPIGKYKIGIVKNEYEGTGGRTYDPEAEQKHPYRIRWLVPKIYADPQSSGLTIEVTSKGIEPAEITLEASKPEVETVKPD